MKNNDMWQSAEAEASAFEILLSSNVITGVREEGEDRADNLVVCICGSKMISDVSGSRYCPRSGSCEGIPERMNVNPECERFLDLATVRSSAWFHATTNPDWHGDVVDANIPVHVGTKESALDRMGILGGAKNEWLLFELELAGDATVFPDFSFDLMDGWPPMLDNFDTLSKGHDFIRYINEMEAPGTISLLGDPSFLQVRSVISMGNSDSEDRIPDSGNMFSHSLGESLK